MANMMTLGIETYLNTLVYYFDLTIAYLMETICSPALMASCL